MKFNFSTLCNPAKLYIVLAVLTFFIGIFNGIGIMILLVNLFFAFIWTYILNWLCKKGYQYFSWFIVLFPYIILLIVLMGVKTPLTIDQRKFLHTIKIQGPI
jgi:hypothetical protein